MTAACGHLKVMSTLSSLGIGISQGEYKPTYLCIGYSYFAIAWLALSSALTPLLFFFCLPWLWLGMALDRAVGPLCCSVMLHTAGLTLLSTSHYALMHRPIARVLSSKLARTSQAGHRHGSGMEAGPDPHALPPLVLTGSPGHNTMPISDLPWPWPQCHGIVHRKLTWGGMRCTQPKTG